jgi:hypothetical protein
MGRAPPLAPEEAVGARHRKNPAVQGFLTPKETSAAAVLRVQF